MSHNLPTVHRTTYWLFAALCVQGGYFIWYEAWSEVFVVVVAGAFSAAPYVVARYVPFQPDQRILAGIVIFVFGTLVLGEIHKFYTAFFWWDLLLHFAAGIGLALLGLVWVYNLIRERIIASYAGVYSVLVFSVSVTVLTLWEVYEFAIDQLQWSENRMQPSLFDTMTDLSIGLAGVMVVCVVGFVRMYRHHRPLEKLVE